MRRPALPWPLLTAVLIAAVAFAPAWVGAAWLQAPADPTPAGEGAQVIAQGVAPLGSADLAWRVERGAAPPPANAVIEDGALGFLLADDGVILVADEATGNQQRLAAGEAAFVRDGDRQVRAALGADAADYYEITLTDAAAATAEDADFVSGPFAGTGGNHDLDLVRGTLDVNEFAALPAGAAPSLLLVTAGTLDVATVEGDASATLTAGEVASVGGAVVLTATVEPATYVAAVVGPAVPALLAPATTPADEETPDAAAATAPVATPDAEIPEPAPTAADLGSPVSEEPATVEETDAAGEGEVLPEETPAPDLSPTADEGLDDDGLPAPVETPAVEDETDTSDEIPTGEETPVNDTPVSETPPAAAETPSVGEPLDDSDGDGLSDAQEQELGTDLTALDSDGDGVSDGDEVQGLGTDPLQPDTDGDGVLDGQELDAGTDPLDPDSTPDGAALGDTDEDGYPDDQELALGTDPNDPDTDDDGLSDGDEVFVYATGPLNPDTDGDGVLDGDEIDNGTDPNDPQDL